MNRTVKQGDSLWLGIVGTISEVDTVWGNWSGSWAIVEILGGEALASGDLIKTETVGKFRFQLPTAVSAALPVGDYILVIQVADTVVDYRNEIAQDKLTIKAQGITP